MNKLYPEERLAAIVKIVEEEERIDVIKLSQYFNVTGATIRNDLKELEQRNLIMRTHGGALRKSQDNISSAHDPSYHKRIVENKDSKELIGREVAKLIQENENLIIDDGSTNLQVAKYLPTDKTITIITNGLNICDELVNHPNTSVIVAGGALNKVDMSFYGRIAEDVVMRYHVDKAILGVSGLSLEAGITAPSEEKAELKKLMIDNCKELIVVADHTKLGKASLITVCPIDKITTLVTDSSEPKDFLDKIKKAGIEVVYAK